MNVDKVIQVRATAELVRDIDEWRIENGLPILSRAEAVRKLIDLALAIHRKENKKPT